MSAKAARRGSPAGIRSRRPPTAGVRSQPNDKPLHRMTESYPDHVTLGEPVAAPLYENAVELVAGSQGRAVLFDFWARGNYARRLLHQRQQGIHPLLVRVTSVDEMRWAHRRLALLGLPVEFIYCGGLAAPSRVVHVDYLPNGHRWDAGWGYVATQWKAHGRYCAMLMGTARLMDEPLIDWLVDEVRGDFCDGNVFVAPAELVGIDPGATDGLDSLASVVGGATVESVVKSGTSFLELDIPFLDQLNPRAFRRFVRQHDAELARFRHAFRRLVTGQPKDGVEARDWIGELRSEVAELTLSDKYHRLRQTVLAAGGVLGIVTATANALSGGSTPVTAVGAGAAGAALLELWKASVESRKARWASPFSVCWNLGIQRPSQVRRAAKVRVATMPVLPPDLNPSYAHHWLCPPTLGVLFAAVRKSPASPTTLQSGPDSPTT
jgi:hypothetical protein